jgi:hypothetical protein
MISPAAAMAEIKRAASWDESEVHRVVVNGSAFDVRLKRRQGWSRARVSGVDS